MTTLNTFDDRYMSRKFWLAAGTFLAALFLLLFGAINATEWVDVSKWVVGLYMIGNVGDTAAEGLKK